MNWDHPIHSFTDPNAEPRTPTRTPVFGDAFQTPKLESSFYDPRVTWNTADPYGSSPDFPPKTPQRSQQRHTRRPSEAETVIEGGQASLQFSPAVEGKSQQENTAGPTEGLESVGQHGNDWQDGDDTGTGLGISKRSAAAMQTPPPTSTTRRRLQNSTTAYEAQTPRPATESTSQLETPSRVIGLSPGLFGLQTTPGLFQFSEHSTASPSFFPQQRMPWDQEPSLHSAASDPYTDSYVMSTQPNEHFGGFDSSLQTPQRQVNRNLMNQLPSTSPFGLDHPDHVTTSFMTSPRAPPMHDDDPAMFLSSPARRFGFQGSDFSPIAPRIETRRPYHFQTQESERDKQEDESKKLQRVRSVGRRQQKALRDREVMLSRAQTVAARSAPRSSLYNVAAAPRARNTSQPISSTGGSVSASAGVRKSPTKGRASPVKTQRLSLAAVPAPMESVVLKIGKDGRAKTEMITQSSPVRPDLHIGFGDDALTESESDDDTDDDDRPVMSFTQNQSSSFNVPDGSPLKRPSFVRSGSKSRPHSKSSSYSSTSAGSRHSPWAGSSWGSGSIRRVVAAAGSRAPSITDSDATQEEASHYSVDNYDDDDDNGDAQHALMRVLKQRRRPSVARMQTGYRAVGRTIRPQSTALPSSPPVYREIRPMGSSPVKPSEDSTPMADRFSGTRCVCRSKENGGHLMIQCESCSHWLHTKCVGLDRQHLPAVYICVYCAQTPRRGSGLSQNSMSMSAGGQASSPLARKSYQS
ncbi:hypothetical protein VTO42DRAFT_1900 [Malbranchea cinnamomea]